MPDGPPQPPKSRKVIRIDSSSSSRPMKSEKERKREQKSLKKINKPKEREKSAVRSEIYNRARADEARGRSTVDGKVAKAYVEGGAKGVEKYDKKVAKKTKTEAPSTPFQHKQKGKAEKQASDDHAKKYFT